VSDFPRRRKDSVSKSRGRRYWQLLQGLPQPILVLGHGHIRFANRAALRVLGATSFAELRGLLYNDFVLSASTLRNGTEQQRLRCLDGRVADVEAMVQGRSSSRRIVLRELNGGTLAREKQEQQLRQAQRMEAVGMLASGIAHDFNNLLTAIHGHAQFMIEDLPDDDPSRADAEEILRSAERAAALTRQLLAFSRGEATQPQTIDLNDVVGSMERLLRRVISESIDLQTSLEPDLWPVRVDPTQMEQVLVNLAVNARDAMPDGGTLGIRTANAELARGYAQNREEVAPGQYVMLSVSDTGIGMDHHTQQHIFEPFYTTKAGKGTGLGLSTVFGIVKQAGGHVFVYSEPGFGTTFKVYLPSPVKDVQGKRSAPAETQPQDVTVLLIDDDPSVRAFARRVLQSRGYNVLMAGSGSEAVNVAAGADGVSVIVTDVVLPDTTGMLLVESLQRQHPKARVLLMSGYSEQDIERRSPLPANWSFIEKPFTPNAFAQRVGELASRAGA
jgi:two-component system, cell cycle sensor histidine kinase and response regulator CckA